MATLTGPQVYATALAAFNRAGITGTRAKVAAARATGVSKMESGWGTTRVGDTGLQSQKWGPSVGLWQIRSLNNQLGSGGPRDEKANTDPAHNADAMVSISSGGNNWNPWTVWSDPGRRPTTQQAAGAAASEAGLSLSEVAAAMGVSSSSPSILGQAQQAVTHPGDVVGAATGAATMAGKSIFGGTLTGLQAIGAVFSVLGDPAFWRRLGMGAIGVALFIAGAHLTLTDLQKRSAA